MSTIDTLLSRSQQPGQWARDDVLWLMLTLLVFCLLITSGLFLAFYLGAAGAYVAMLFCWTLIAHTLLIHIEEPTKWFSTHKSPRLIGTLLVTSGASFCLSMPMLAMETTNVWIHIIRGSGILLFPVLVHKSLEDGCRYVHGQISTKYIHPTEFNAMVQELGTLAFMHHQIDSPQVELIVQKCNAPFSLCKWKALCADRQGGHFKRLHQVDGLTLNPMKGAAWNLGGDEDTMIMRFVLTPKPLSAHERFTLLKELS